MSLLSRAFKIHQYCLDAPAVALSAYVLVCRIDGRWVDWGSAVIIFLTVWLAYLGDRWMDARRNPRAALTSPRHQVFVHEPDQWLRAWVVILGVNVVMSTIALSLSAWLYGLSLGLGSVVYTFWSQRLAWRGPQKELFVGILFGWVAGGFTPWEGSLTAWTTMFAIACLCALNCLSVSWTERELDVQRGERSAFSHFVGGLMGPADWRIVIALMAGGLFAAAWVSVSFALLCAVYLGGLACMTKHERSLSRAGFSLIADWGILAVFILAAWIS